MSHGASDPLGRYCLYEYVPLCAFSELNPAVVICLSVSEQYQLLNPALHPVVLQGQQGGGVPVSKFPSDTLKYTVAHAGEQTRKNVKAIIHFFICFT